jgi:hypothetical protein
VAKRRRRWFGVANATACPLEACELFCRVDPESRRTGKMKRFKQGWRGSLV